jgi:hypothetical protein
MSETTILDNSNRPVYDYNGLYADGGYGGIGSQIILYTATTLTELVFSLSKNGLPTGHIVAKVFNSLTGNFLDPADRPDGAAVATSTSTLDVETLDANRALIVFEFNSDVLQPGVYFVCIYSEDLGGDGSVVYWWSDPSHPQVGYATFYWTSEGRWGSWMEWD